jgi:NNP family nitrate/nitrite transporter-like MFS transporter
MPLIASGFNCTWLLQQGRQLACGNDRSWYHVVGLCWLYYRYTKDTPAGDYKEIGYKVDGKRNTFLVAAKDYRTWILTIAYAACFGVEITVDNFRPDIFLPIHLVPCLAIAGMCAGIFWLDKYFRPPYGGYRADKIGKVWGFRWQDILIGCSIIAGRDRPYLVCEIRQYRNGDLHDVLLWPKP